MKRLLLTLSLLALAPLSARADDVTAAQNQVKQARQSYYAAAQKSGPASPEAVVAKSRLDASRHTLQSKLQERQKARRLARHQIQH